MDCCNLKTDSLRKLKQHKLSTYSAPMAQMYIALLGPEEYFLACYAHSLHIALPRITKSHEVVVN